MLGDGGDDSWTKDKSGTWSLTGVGTQITTTSAEPMPSGSEVKRRSPEETPIENARSFTPGTLRRPAPSSPTRSSSMSMPTSANPRSAASQARDSPTYPWPRTATAARPSRMRSTSSVIALVEVSPMVILGPSIPVPRLAPRRRPVPQRGPVLTQSAGGVTARRAPSAIWILRSRPGAPLRANL
jgi:hypothetical protein